jgi:hypothetical protein
MSDIMKEAAEAAEAAEKYGKNIHDVNLPYRVGAVLGFQTGYTLSAILKHKEIDALKAEIGELQSEIKVYRADNGHFD